MDFKNTLIIMTSNVGSSVIEKGGGGLGFQLNEDAEASSYNRIKTLVNEELKQYFRPEFLNRLDEIIVFRQLTKLEVKQIADIMLNEVFKRMDAKGMSLSVTERFKDRLVDEGYSPAYGARPLRRAIMRMLEDCLAERMLAGEIKVRAPFRQTPSLQSARSCSLPLFSWAVAVQRVSIPRGMNHQNASSRQQRDSSDSLELN